MLNCDYTATYILLPSSTCAKLKMSEDNEVVSEKTNSTEEVSSANGKDVTTELTDLESSIIRQMEFYFDDLNLIRDKFLQEQIKLDEGWVPLDVLTRFNRLAKLTTDTDVIADAVSKSESGLLVVSEDKKKVRRNPEMPLPEMNEEVRKEIVARTLYVKGFPLDAAIDDIIKFMNPYEVKKVTMRWYLDKKTHKKKFKGSVFATFQTKEQAQKFLDLKDLKYKDTPLLIKWQEDYLEEKREEYATRKDKKDKKHKDKDTKQKKGDSFKLPTGTVLHFSQGHDKMTREDVKSALTPLGADVAYIDFKVGASEGWVRLNKENTAKEIADKIPDGKIKIGDTEVIFRVLDTEEETEFLKKTVEEMTERRHKMKQNKQSNKGRNFRGKPNRKRKQDEPEDAPPAKIGAKE